MPALGCGCRAAVHKLMDSGFSVVWLSLCAAHDEQDHAALTQALREDGPADSKHLAPDDVPRRAVGLTWQGLRWHSTEPAAEAPAAAPPRAERRRPRAAPAEPRPASRDCLSCGQPFAPAKVNSFHCAQPACRKAQIAAAHAARWVDPAYRSRKSAVAKARYLRLKAEAGANAGI
jgi:hypothetical protein